ncbi:MAG: MFS transporter [Thermoplasmata archaeon]|nr:MFS transporter [Thermoplasmata archaeon]
MTAAESSEPPSGVPTAEEVKTPVLAPVVSIFVLVGVFLAVLMGAMDALVVATVLPNIAGELHQVNGVTFVVSAYLISSTISIPIFARLSDITSRRNVFLLGLSIFMAGSALAGLSQNMAELIAFRGLQGFGGGGVFPVAIAMITVLYPPETRGRVTGLLSGAGGLAIVLGPLVGSYIVSVSTWRWVFYINLPFGILAMLVLLFAVGPLRPALPGRFDTPGALLLSGWVGSLMFALVQVSDAGWAWSDPRIVGLLAVAVALFAVFLVFELRATEPLVPFRLLKRKAIAASGGAMMFTGVVLSSVITFLSVFVGIVLLHNGPNSTADVRDMIYFVAIPMILGAAIAGQLSTRFPYRTVVAPGLAVAAVAALFLTNLTLTTPLWVLHFGFLPTGGLVLPLIPLGFGLGFSLSGTTIAVQNEAPMAEVGSAIGLTRFFQSLGGALGISLLTVFQTWRFQSLSAGATTAAALEHAQVTAFNEVFLVLAVCIAVAFTFSLFLVGRVRRTPDSDPATGSSSSGSPSPGGEPAPAALAADAAKLSR